MAAMYRDPMTSPRARPEQSGGRRFPSAWPTATSSLADVPTSSAWPWWTLEPKELVRGASNRWHGRCLSSAFPVTGRRRIDLRLRRISDLLLYALGVHGGPLTPTPPSPRSHASREPLLRRPPPSSRPPLRCSSSVPDDSNTTRRPAHEPETTAADGALRAFWARTAGVPLRRARRHVCGRIGGDAAVAVRGGASAAIIGRGELHS